jgi:hypothetical protein
MIIPLRARIKLSLLEARLRLRHWVTSSMVMEWDLIEVHGRQGGSQGPRVTVDGVRDIHPPTIARPGPRMAIVTVSSFDFERGVEAHGYTSNRLPRSDRYF